MVLPASAWVFLAILSTSVGTHGVDHLKSGEYYEEYEDEVPLNTTYKLNVPNSFTNYLEHLLTKGNSVDKGKEQDKDKTSKNVVQGDKKEKVEPEQRETHQKQSHKNKDELDIGKDLQSLSNTLQSSGHLHSNTPNIFHPYGKSNISHLLSSLGNGSTSVPDRRNHTANPTSSFKTDRHDLEHSSSSQSVKKSNNQNSISVAKNNTSIQVAKVKKEHGLQSKREIQKSNIKDALPSIQNERPPADSSGQNNKIKSSLHERTSNVALLDDTKRNNSTERTESSQVTSLGNTSKSKNIKKANKNRTEISENYTNTKNIHINPKVENSANKFNGTITNLSQLIRNSSRRLDALKLKDSEQSLNNTKKDGQRESLETKKLVSYNVSKPLSPPTVSPKIDTSRNSNTTTGSVMFGNNSGAHSTKGANHDKLIKNNEDVGNNKVLRLQYPSSNSNEGTIDNKNQAGKELNSTSVKKPLDKISSRASVNILPPLVKNKRTTQQKTVPSQERFLNVSSTDNKAILSNESSLLDSEEKNLNSNPNASSSIGLSATNESDLDTKLKDQKSISKINFKSEDLEGMVKKGLKKDSKESSGVKIERSNGTNKDDVLNHKIKKLNKVNRQETAQDPSHIDKIGVNLSSSEVNNNKLRINSHDSNDVTKIRNSSGVQPLPNQNNQQTVNSQNNTNNESNVVIESKTRPSTRIRNDTQLLKHEERNSKTKDVEFKQPISPKTEKNNINVTALSETIKSNETEKHPIQDLLNSLVKINQKKKILKRRKKKRKGKKRLSKSGKRLSNNYPVVGVNKLNTHKMNKSLPLESNMKQNTESINVHMLPSLPDSLTAKKIIKSPLLSSDHNYNSRNDNVTLKSDNSTNSLTSVSVKGQKKTEILPVAKSVRPSKETKNETFIVNGKESFEGNDPELQFTTSKFVHTKKDVSNPPILFNQTVATKINHKNTSHEKIPRQNKTVDLKSPTKESNETIDSGLKNEAKHISSNSPTSESGKKIETIQETTILKPDNNRTSLNRHFSKANKTENSIKMPMAHFLPTVNKTSAQLAELNKISASKKVLTKPTNSITIIPIKSAKSSGGPELPSKSNKTLSSDIGKEVFRLPTTNGTTNMKNNTLNLLSTNRLINKNENLTHIKELSSKTAKEIEVVNKLDKENRSEINNQVPIVNSTLKNNTNYKLVEPNITSIKSKNFESNPAQNNTKIQIQNFKVNSSNFNLNNLVGKNITVSKYNKTNSSETGKEVFGIPTTNDTKGFQNNTFKAPNTNLTLNENAARNELKMTNSTKEIEIDNSLEKLNKPGTINNISIVHSANVVNTSDVQSTKSLKTTTNTTNNVQNKPVSNSTKIPIKNKNIESSKVNSNTSDAKDIFSPKSDDNPSNLTIKTISWLFPSNVTKIIKNIKLKVPNSKEIANNGTIYSKQHLSNHSKENNFSFLSHHPVKSTKEAEVEGFQNSTNKNKTVANIAEQSDGISNTNRMPRLLRKMYNVLKLYLRKNVKNNDIDRGNTKRSPETNNSVVANINQNKTVLGKVVKLEHKSEGNTELKGIRKQENQTVKTKDNLTGEKNLVIQPDATNVLQKESDKKKPHTKAIQNEINKTKDQQSNDNLTVTNQRPDSLQTETKQNISSNGNNKTLLNQTNRLSTLASTESSNNKPNEHKVNVNEDSSRVVEKRPNSNTTLVDFKHDDHLNLRTNQTIVLQNSKLENKQEVNLIKTSTKVEKGDDVKQIINNVNHTINASDSVLESTGQKSEHVNDIASSKPSMKEHLGMNSQTVDARDNRTQHLQKNNTIKNKEKRSESTKTDNEQNKVSISNNIVKSSAGFNNSTDSKTLNLENNHGGKVSAMQADSNNSYSNYTDGNKEKSAKHEEHNSKSLPKTKQEQSTTYKNLSDINVHHILKPEIKRNEKKISNGSKIISKPVLKIKYESVDNKLQSLKNNSITNVQTLQSNNSLRKSHLNQNETNSKSTEINSNTTTDTPKFNLKENAYDHPLMKKIITEDLSQNSRLHIIITPLDIKPNVSVEIGVERRNINGSETRNPWLLQTKNLTNLENSEVVNGTNNKSNTTKNSNNVLRSGEKIMPRGASDLFSFKRQLDNRSRTENPSVPNETFSNDKHLSRKSTSERETKHRTATESKDQSTNQAQNKTDKDESSKVREDVALDVKNMHKVTNRKRVTKKEEVVEVNERMKENKILGKSKSVQTIKTEISSVDYV